MLKNRVCKASFLVVLGILFMQVLTAQVRVFVHEPDNSLSYWESLSLSVNVEGLTAAESLRGFQVHFDIDDTYLEISGIGAFTEGSFLSSVGPTQWYVIEEDGGYTATCSILDYTPGATGSGTLFTVNLTARDQATGLAGTDVLLSSIILRNPLNQNIGFTFANGNVVINPGVMIYVDLPHYDLYYYEEVTLAVKIDGTPDLSLRGYQVHFDFDDTYLEISGLNAFQEGSFLSSIGPTQWYVIAENGGYTATCSILDYTPGAFNSGTLFYVTLKAKNQSTGLAGTDILLSDIILRDPLNHPIEYVSENGNIVIEPPLYIYTGIKVFLQGPYITGTGGAMSHILSDNGYIPLTSPYDASLTLASFPNVSPKYIVDWVYVQLRATSNGADEQPQSCFLLNDGTVVDVAGSPYLPFNYIGGIEYYTIIQHRNHLEAMSANPVTFSVDPLAVSIADLTVLDSVYGGNLYGVKQIEPGILALYSGDANQDGVIGSTDSSYWRVQAGLLYGYYVSDFNLESNVHTTDLNGFWRPNSGKLSQIP